jgi:CO/xanthine dehydrogenase Mo-binding subunit
MQDQPILALDKVRYIGDPIAAVSALDEEAAEEALSLIKVDYEEVPSVFDPTKSMESDAVLIHEGLGIYEYISSYISPVPETNICNHFKLRVGDVGKDLRTR